MEDKPDQSVDESRKIIGSGSITEIRMLGMDKPFFTALAVVLSFGAAVYAFNAGNRFERYVYWMQRYEAFMEQLATQGVNVPKDILDHIKKEHEK